jgi:hypothetical protein
MLTSRPGRFPRLLAIVFALAVLVVLPASLVLIPHVCEGIGTLLDLVRRAAERRRSLPGADRRARREFRRMDRMIERAVGELPRRPVGAPIERVAADLRRLSRERLDERGRSSWWQSVIQRVYDDRLGAACRQLDIEEHLAELSGVDLAIERIRVEDALRGAGVVIESERSRGRPDHR